MTQRCKGLSFQNVTSERDTIRTILRFTSRSFAQHLRNVLSEHKCFMTHLETPERFNAIHKTLLAVLTIDIEAFEEHTNRARLSTDCSRSRVVVAGVPVGV